MKLATIAVLASALLASACAPVLTTGGGHSGGHAAHAHGSQSSGDWLASQPISWGE
ncbi:MAG: hypothetical protein JNM79_25490 [Burkholderiales bacterium]|nr:hypothetical protein [Burkholderiales bacterium]